MTSLRQDFSAAIRFFGRKKSAFTIIVTTVALALAANTTAFSIVRGFFFANLGVEDANSVVVVTTVKTLPGQGPIDFSDAYPNYRLLRDTTHSFSDISATLPMDISWREDETTRRLQGQRVTASFFAVMRVKTCIGRFFNEQEEGPHAAPVAVISYKLWRSAFAGSADTLGKVMQLNGTPHTIVGVMAQGFDQPTDAEIWLPFDLPEALWRAVVAGRQCNVYARLAPNASLNSANQELHAFADTAIRFDPANKDWSWRARTLRETLLNNSDAVVISIQAGAAVLLLLAICNLVSVLLAWGAEREQETALRRALGASTGRIVRQFVVQTLVLVGAAGAAALLLSWFILPALKQLNPDQSLGSLLEHVQIETGTVAFAAGVVIIAGLVAGLLPAWQTRWVGLEIALRRQTRGGGASSKAVRWQQAMVVLQAAIAVLILASALMAGVTLYRLTQVSLGFLTADRVVFRIELPEPALNTHDKRVLFARTLEENLAREPALNGYGFTTTLPVGDGNWGGSYRPQLPSGEYANEPCVFQLRRVSAGYIGTMGIPLLQGRLFNDRDRNDSMPVAIVSKTLAGKYWPDGSAIGRKVRKTSPPNTEFEIVGVVNDVRDNGPADVIPETIYIPFEQFSHRHASIVLYARHSIPDAIAAGRRALLATNRDVAAFDIATLDDLASQALALPRLEFALFAGFALMALSITGLGAYGVMCQVVGVREKEFAIRSALGASRGNVVRLIAWQNAKFATIGIAGGLVAAWIATRSLRAVIPSFESTPMVGPLILVGLIILVLTQCAGLLPLRRAITPAILRLLNSA